MFFKLPPNSTPARSLLVYTRNVAPLIAVCNSCAASSTLPSASTIAAGSPRATSAAFVGPVIDPAIAPGNTAAITCDGRWCVPSSSPFARLTTNRGTLPPSASFTRAHVSRNACAGHARKITSAPTSAARSSLSTRNPSGSAIPGR